MVADTPNCAKVGLESSMGFALIAPRDRDIQAGSRPVSYAAVTNFGFLASSENRVLAMPLKTI